jgi:hypothetical protein
VEFPLPGMERRIIRISVEFWKKKTLAGGG